VAAGEGRPEGCVIAKDMVQFPVMDALRPPAQIEVRVAQRADAPRVHRLLSFALRSLVYPESWEEHLGEASFLLTWQADRLLGALLACSEAGPVAWVRLAALATGLGVGVWLDRCLPVLAVALRREGARMLAWTDAGGWAGPALRARGFHRSTRLITLVKVDRSLPSTSAPHVGLRPGRVGDVEALVRIDHAAFSPPWWLGSRTLQRLVQESACFLVAEHGGRCVGYVEARQFRDGAHIGRVVVAPAFQGRGIGGRLLAQALRWLWQQGASRVTLNTQEENQRSRRLYSRFEFYPLGRRVDVWERLL